MEKQLTIFDLLSDERSLDDMTEEEMAEEVGKRLGLTFQLFRYDANIHEYRAKYKDLLLTCEYDTYYGTQTRFIGVGYDDKKEKSGGGAPCDSIDEAVGWLKRLIAEREAKNERGRMGHRRTA